MSSLVDSSRVNKIILNENLLALLIKLVFSPIVEVFVTQVDKVKVVDESKEGEATEFEHEDGDEKAQAVISSNTKAKYNKVPDEVVELSIKIFGEQRAAALINLFNRWNKSQIYNIPAITNSILAIPVQFANIFSASITNLSWSHFYNDILEKVLNIIYKMVLTSNEKDLKKFIYALDWPMRHRINSVSNSMNIIACEDFIEYFPELEIKVRAVSGSTRVVIRAEEEHRNQIIFDLIIHHMQACERLFNIQNQDIFKSLNDPRVFPTNLGPDINTLICKYNSTLETQGLFAKRFLRQMPEDKQLDIQDFLAGPKQQ
ncbi:MAG: hypothetical protein V4501_00875 [Pseudomonadota bacterium]